MWELIDFIQCRITIITNWLPTYQILLFIYLSIPLIIITYYQNKNPQVKPIILAIILLIIWLIQMIIWDKGYNEYYL